MEKNMLLVTIEKAFVNLAHIGDVTEMLEIAHIIELLTIALKTDDIDELREHLIEAQDEIKYLAGLDLGQLQSAHDEMQKIATKERKEFEQFKDLYAAGFECEKEFDAFKSSVKLFMENVTNPFIKKAIQEFLDEI